MYMRFVPYLFPCSCLSLVMSSYIAMFVPLVHVSEHYISFRSFSLFSICLIFLFLCS